MNQKLLARTAYRGWYSRGYLPHLDEPGLVQAITFRLVDALPASRRTEWQALLAESNDRTRRKNIEAYLDAGHGSCSLRDPKIARIVEDALLHFDGRRYHLLAWVVMPNHVHVLIETGIAASRGALASNRERFRSAGFQPAVVADEQTCRRDIGAPSNPAGETPALPGSALASIIHSWKSFTAKQANRLLDRDGDFWQREYFDRFIRDDEHYRKAVEYIHNNPLKAGLVQQPEDWSFSSARRAGSAGVPPARLR